jgi:hypothetical protein
MILSKNSLQVFNVCAPDKSNAALNCVCIEPNGAVVASNSKVWCWVSPLSAKRVDLVPLQSGEVHERIIISAGSVEKILKAIPKDTQYKGLLEHCDITRVDGGKPALIVTTTDGKQTHSINVNAMAVRYPEYRKLFADAWASVQGVNVFVRETHNRLPIQACLNRKRLSNVCAVVDKVCSYDGQFAPTWWFFAADGSVLMKSVNELTEQVIWCLFGASETDVVPWTPDECRLFARERKALKI